MTRHDCVREMTSRFNPVFATLPETVFERMSGLARRHGAINLGQGFPDGQGPDDIRAAAAAAFETVSNQYPPMMGLASLRRAVAAHYGTTSVSISIPSTR